MEMTQGWRMQRRLSPAKPTTGGTGVWHGAGTASTSGVMLQPWSCPMGLTAGSASSWMASWQPCIPLAALKEALKARVCKQMVVACFLFLCNFYLSLDFFLYASSNTCRLWFWGLADSHSLLLVQAILFIMAAVICDTCFAHGTPPSKCSSLLGIGIVLFLCTSIFVIYRFSFWENLV